MSGLFDANALGLTPAEVEELLEADSHWHSCRCEKCLRWWVRCGADPDRKSYGPFTDAEILAEKDRLRQSGGSL